MLHTYSAGASRRALVLTGIIGLHLGVFLIVAADRIPPVNRDKESGPILVPVKPPPPKPTVGPPAPQPGTVTVTRVERPDIVIPRFPDEEIRTGETPGEPGAGPAQAAQPESVINPTIAMRGKRLAALIDSCYPPGSRRDGEEGKIVVRLAVGPDAKVTSWRIAQGSGFARLDAAVPCVVEKLVFAAGSRNGQAAMLEVMLPIVFRLR